MSVRKITTSVFSLLILFALTSCSYITNTQSNIEKQINEANYCEVDSDCALAGSQCPFGCYIYVNANEQARIKTLIDNFDSRCEYSCIACEQVLCQNNKCVVQCDGQIYSK